RATPLVLPGGMVGSSVTALAQDPNGALWIGTTAGLARLQNGRIYQIGASEGVNEIGCRTVLVDRNGVVWVSILHQGLLRWQDNKFMSVPIPPNMSVVEPYCLMMDKSGRLWAGLTQGRVLCRDKDKWRVYGPQDGLPPVMITGLAQGLD